ncbi:ORF114 [Ranid herpesvirus 2]|uniref:ORF114 n=1 Tax=Ranid herpesvirus 2 TaxID=389214 RepID=Q14VZ2_9VIRU|nr:ORF114 [Ranid herpesvirus 2]ABG25647.1 ORF114 [Ranid herpesvirus 2]
MHRSFFSHQRPYFTSFEVSNVGEIQVALDFSALANLPATNTVLLLKKLTSNLKTLLPHTSPSLNVCLFNLADFVDQWNSTVDGFEDYLAQQNLPVQLGADQAQFYAHGWLTKVLLKPSVQCEDGLQQNAAWSMLHSNIKDGKHASKFINSKGLCLGTRDEGITHTVTVLIHPTERHKYVENPKLPIQKFADSVGGLFLVSYPSQSRFAEDSGYQLTRWELLQCASLKDVYRWLNGLKTVPVNWNASVLVFGQVNTETTDLVHRYPRWEYFRRQWEVEGAKAKDDYSYNKDYEPPARTHLRRLRPLW